VGRVPERRDADQSSSTFGLLLSLLWGQALLLSRMLIRVWTFAAVDELQHLREWP